MQYPAWNPIFRASKLKYNDVEDERHGTNLLIMAAEDFSSYEVRTIGNLDTPSHGFRDGRTDGWTEEGEGIFCS